MKTKREKIAYIVCLCIMVILQNINIGSNFQYVKFGLLQYTLFPTLLTCIYVLQKGSSIENKKYIKIITGIFIVISMLVTFYFFLMATGGNGSFGIKENSLLASIQMPITCVYWYLVTKVE